MLWVLKRTVSGSFEHPKHMLKIVSEYNLEIPQSQTADNPMVRKYTHVQFKRTTLPMRIFVAYQKLCKLVLFIIIS